MTNISKKIDLGCGDSKPEGYYGVDIAPTAATDKIQDLDAEEWDLPSNHFTHVRAIDVFEHLSRPINFMEEVYRITTSGADVIIQGPHISSGNWHDPTHKRLLGSRSFEHFTDQSRFQHYTDSQFHIEEYEITFEWTEFPPSKRLGSYIANNHTSIYENTVLRSVFPATNIRFYLTPVEDWY